MLNVDHIVAHAEVFQRGKEGSRSAFRLRLVTRPFREEFFFRQEREPEIGGEESRRQLPMQDIEGDPVHTLERPG